MGVVNVTPDSFYSPSRCGGEEELRARVRQIVSEGGSIIDIGGCSTRPGGELAEREEELSRLLWAMDIVTRMPEISSVCLSIDTFRADVARTVIERYGDVMVNDVSEGEDPEMFATVASLGVPYVLTSRRGTLRETMLAFAEKVQRLRDLGAKDILLDPGFGFGKTIEQNFRMLRDLPMLREFELPIVVGLSRKSMICRTLGCTADEALAGTIALNTLALNSGAADILRVHDVREARDVMTLMASMEI